MLALLNALLGTSTAVRIFSGLAVWRGLNKSSPPTVPLAVTGLVAMHLVIVHLAWNQKRRRGLLRGGRDRRHRHMAPRQ